MMDKVIKNGWMSKEGGALRTVQRRWFVLSSSGLAYFKTEKMGHPQGLISLREGVSCFVNTSRSHTFVVHTKTRDYVLIADSQATMNEWMSAISFCVRKTIERQLCCHNLKKLSASSQVECACCCERIAHMGRQAYRCEDCGLFIHTKCYTLLDSAPQLMYCKAGGM
ncbi:hypothetical protein Pelo_12666 [Pelomyxa schiedti]|nr:hypothetical protein Pelo_12666 [Pelomyxa schiedti]